MTNDRSRSGVSASLTSSTVLATAEQIDAERTVLHLLKDEDAELRRIQASIKAELAATPKGRAGDGAATLDAAIEQWTHSLIFTELSSYRPGPAILWGTDDSARTWLGQTVGLETSVYNPDGIFRQTYLDGAGRYEVTGRFDQTNRAVQLVMEEFRGDLTHSKRNADKADPGGQPILMTDRDLVVDPDGTFRMTLGGSADGPNHVAMRPGQFTLLFREMLSDWNQRPCRLAIRRLDSTEAEPFDLAELRRRVHADLGDFIGFWSAFPDSFFGGLKPNTVAGPAGRGGGWGLIAGLRYELAPDEAMLVTTSRGDAAYTGFQLLDPWMVAADPRRHQVCLNLSQVAPNADGSVTYVISSTDPGVANWLDTAGLHEGFGMIRWQALPSGATDVGLLLDSRVVRLSELGSMEGIPRISAEQRRAQLAARAESYNSRMR